MEIAGPFQVLAHQLWIKPDKRVPLATGEAVVPKAVQASSSDAEAQAANLINQSGLRDGDMDGLDEHNSDVRQMWLSAQGQPQGWVEFDFGAPQKLSTICIWNFNDVWRTDRGVQKADVSVWTQDAGWRKVRENVPLEQAEGGDDYDEPTVVTLDQITAQKVRLDNLASFGAADCVGLSEVRFFKPRGPEAVRPHPLDGTQGAAVGELVLGWMAGEGAKAHNVYLGEKPDDLKLLGKVEQVSAKLSGLNPDTKYYWRVDEVLADGSTAPSRVWSFTTAGLAGWWKLDETEGTKVADSSGKGHEGVIHGGPVWQPAGGKVAGALQFDGVDDYVDTGWAPQLPTWTVAAWVKSPAAPTSPVASGPVHAEKNFQINWNHGTDQCRGAAGVCVGGAWHAAGFGELKADTWYHLAATYDGENLKAYKDGVLIMDKADPSGNADLETETLKFGRHALATDAFFTGTVDDVCVFAYPLNVDEVRALYFGKEPSEIAGRPSSTGPHLVQMASTASVQPAVVPAPTAEAPAQPQPQVQPAGAEVSGPENAAPQPSRTSRNILAVVVIVTAVGLIAGASTVGRKKRTSGE